MGFALPSDSHRRCKNFIIQMVAGDEVNLCYKARNGTGNVIRSLTCIIMQSFNAELYKGEHPWIHVHGNL